MALTRPHLFGEWTRLEDGVRILDATSYPRFCSSPCLAAGMGTYHPVEAAVNIQKMFWNRKEVSYHGIKRRHGGCIEDRMDRYVTE